MRLWKILITEDWYAADTDVSHGSRILLNFLDKSVSPLGASMGPCVGALVYARHNSWPSRLTVTSLLSDGVSSKLYKARQWNRVLGTQPLVLVVFISRNEGVRVVVAETANQAVLCGYTS